MLPLPKPERRTYQRGPLLSPSALLVPALRKPAPRSELSAGSRMGAGLPSQCARVRGRKPLPGTAVDAAEEGWSSGV